jgi:hypothetical protein
MHASRLAVGFVLLAAVASAQTTTAPPGVKCDDACLQAKIDRHLALMGEFDNEEQLQASQRELAALGPRVVRVAYDTYNQWTRAERPDPKTAARPGEMRWRVTYLLGVLGQRDAVPLLFAIGKRMLPDPRCSEQAYADEYRVRLRAIVGLENLKAVDELKQLYELGGVFQNPTAASLYVLGVNVGNVSRVDVKRALAEDVADPKDYNPNRGRAAQPGKPGAQRADTKRREDTPAVKKEQ